jgi:hypothetical protein
MKPNQHKHALSKKQPIPVSIDTWLDFNDPYDSDVEHLKQNYNKENDFSSDIENLFYVATYSR